MDVSDPSSASPPGAERKLVAVLVCEIDAPTPRSGAEHDPDQRLRLSARNFARMQAEIARHDGIVAEVMGDALLAVFGVPRTREDDAERAVRTALAIRAAVTSPDVDDGGQLRAGVASGEAVVRLGEAAAGSRWGEAGVNLRRSGPGRGLACH